MALAMSAAEAGTSAEAQRGVPKTGKRKKGRGPAEVVCTGTYVEVPEVEEESKDSPELPVESQFDYMEAK